MSPYFRWAARTIRFLLSGDIARGMSPSGRRSRRQPLEVPANAQRRPPQIRRALTGYIDEASLDRARFKIGDRGVLNLAGLSIKYGDFLGGDAAAVTLNDIIVFADANNPALWAHELTHVEQFKNGNVHDFSIAYARSSASMEGPTYAKGDNFWNWYDSQDESDSNGAQQSTQLYWIGVAGNQFGAVATRTGANLAEAQALALDACNEVEGGGCANGAKPIPGDRFMCYAIYRDSNVLYESIDPNPAHAVADTLQSCQHSNDPGPGCELLVSSCNDRQ
jgi:Domain of unknown function (DUF4157)